MLTKLVKHLIQQGFCGEEDARCEMQANPGYNKTRRPPSSVMPESRGLDSTLGTPASHPQRPLRIKCSEDSCLCQTDESTSNAEGTRINNFLTGDLATPVSTNGFLILFSLCSPCFRGESSLSHPRRKYRSHHQHRNQSNVLCALTAGWLR